MTKVVIYNKNNGDIDTAPMYLSKARKLAKKLNKQDHDRYGVVPNFGILHAKKNKTYSVNPKRKSRR
jgi:hypothetical protein